MDKSMAKQWGVGYSEVAAQLMMDLSQPVQNNDAMLDNYHDMSELDETIATGLEFLAYSVVRKIQPYTNEDSRAQQLVEDCVNSIKGTIEEARKSVLINSVVYGFGVGEFSLFPRNSQWLLSSMSVYDSRSLRFIMGKEKDNSIGIKAVRQGMGFNEVDIPAEKCWIYRYNAITSPYGKSRLKRCWRWYAFKKAIPRLWAIALERYGMPALIGKSADTTQMMDMLSQLYSNAYAAILPDDEISILEKPNGTGLGASYETAISFCNKMMYRSLFLPSLLEGGEGGGSYALGQVHWDMFDDACLWLAKELAESELEHLWRPLIEWNLGEQDDYGDLPVANTQSPEDQKILTEIFTNSVNSGVLYPDEGDSVWMREKLGFPRFESEVGGEPVAWRANLQIRAERQAAEAAALEGKKAEEEKKKPEELQK